VVGDGLHAGRVTGGDGVGEFGVEGVEERDGAGDDVGLSATSASRVSRALMMASVGLSMLVWRVMACAVSACWRSMRARRVEMSSIWWPTR
jgi:hypothetical protein